VSIRPRLIGALILSWVVAASLPTVAKAAVFSLPTVSTSMTDPIFRTLGADFAFRSVEPASDLGTVWGLNFGVAAVATDASAVSSIFSNMATSFVPNADFQLGIGLPKGITIELGLVPKVKLDGTTFSKYEAALKWTLNRTLIPRFPLDVATRFSYSNGSIDYSQGLNGGTVSVSYRTTVIGGNLLVSKFLGAAGFGIEPFLGVGLINFSSTLSGSGTVNLFDTSFPTGTESVSDSGLSSWLQAGLQLKLSVVAFAAEYDRFFGISSWTGKFSIRI
jgi:hypothetical protein